MSGLECQPGGRSSDLCDGNPQNPAHVLPELDGNLSGFGYDNEEVSLVAVPGEVRYLCERWLPRVPQLGRFGKLDWGDRTTVRTPASESVKIIRGEVAIPWTAINSGGIPSSFVFFGYLTSSGGYVYGQAPADNPGAVIGTNATYTQYYAVTNTGNGTSTPPFSLEQPAGFSATDKAGFYHNTFDPFYRDHEGAVPENT
jgi:hypothetical protein